MKKIWLRWPVFLAGILIFLFFSVIFDERLFLHAGSLGTKIVESVTFIFFGRLELEKIKLIEAVVLGFLPAVIACFTALFQKFWFEFPLGLWFIYYSFIYLQKEVSMLILLVILGSLLLPALILCFSPFVKLVLEKENFYSEENYYLGKDHYQSEDEISEEKNFYY